MCTDCWNCTEPVAMPGMCACHCTRRRTSSGLRVPTTARYCKGVVLRYLAEGPSM